MKKLFTVLFSVIIIQGCELAEGTKQEKTDRSRDIEVFKTEIGVECIWKSEDLGLNGIAGGLSCNWGKWNKERNYQSIVR